MECQDQEFTGYRRQGISTPTGQSSELREEERQLRLFADVAAALKGSFYLITCERDRRPDVVVSDHSCLSEEIIFMEKQGHPYIGYGPELRDVVHLNQPQLDQSISTGELKYVARGNETLESSRNGHYRTALNVALFLIEKIRMEIIRLKTVDGLRVLKMPEMHVQIIWLLHLEKQNA